MSWVTITNWAIIVGVILAIASLINKKDINAELRRVLVDPGPLPWTERAHSAFLGVFKLLYGRKNTEQTEVEEVVWLALLLTPLMLMVTEVVFAASYLATGRSNRIIEDFQNCNEAGLFITITVAFVISGSRLFIDRIWSSRKQRVVGTFLVGLFLTPLMTVVGYWISTGPCTERDVISMLREQWQFVPMIGGPGGLLATVVVALRPPLKWIPIHPIKALASSAVFMALIGLFRRDDVVAFVDALNTQGITLLGLVALNIFADTVSLAETRWLLTLGAKAKVHKLVGLLVLDLILSAIIFLVLPTMVLESLDTTFWEGLVFQGQERPWLGILFFTTFSTSILLYLFIPTSLLLRPLSHILRAASSRPIVGDYLVVLLALIMSMIVTLVFVSVKLVVMLS